MNLRSPIVVVLGHVDHGKTSLLDAIRKTNVHGREAGGITQTIGASVVTTSSNKKITFIDTPGHAAFAKMRGRGAQLADIAILVVAGDDGVAPQTKESLSFIKTAEIPMILAITKTDLATSQSEMVLSQLEKEGLMFEKRGGDTPWLEVSAKTGKGITELLDLISLLAEVKEVKGDANADLEAVVIETAKEKGGLTVSAVVRNGHIKVGETIYFNGGECKVRNLAGATGNVKEITPGEPVKILGFNSLPEVGSILHSSAFDGQKQEKVVESKKIGKNQIGIFLKAQNAGALEAVLANLPADVVVIESSVGDVYESDVLNAKASGIKAIYLFEAKAQPTIIKLAEAEDVKIKRFEIIYELLNDLAEVLKKGLVEVLGKAEVIASFPFNNKKVAGCKMISGKIGKGDTLLLKRGEAELGKVRILSLKKAKTEVSVVAQGEEFGVIFTPQLDFTIGDAILAIK